MMILLWIIVVLQWLSFTAIVLIMIGVGRMREDNQFWVNMTKAAIKKGWMDNGRT